MNTVNRTSRVLGIAFLLQFVTSFSNGVFLKPALIAPGGISESMIKIANNPSLMRAYIFVDMLTALGIIFLGAILFLTLRKRNETIALVALGFYILEAALLAVSRLEAFSLLSMSQAYVAAGQPASLQTMANVALEIHGFCWVYAAHVGFLSWWNPFLLPALQVRGCSACAVSLGSNHRFALPDRNPARCVWL